MHMIALHYRNAMYLQVTEQRRCVRTKLYYKSKAVLNDNLNTWGEMKINKNNEEGVYYNKQHNKLITSNGTFDFHQNYQTDLSISSFLLQGIPTAPFHLLMRYAICYWELLKPHCPMAHQNLLLLTVFDTHY